MARKKWQKQAPRMGHLRALGRFFRDRSASKLGKLFVLATLIYVISPIDLSPDVVPVVGWLDDVGLIGVAVAYLHRVIDRYRYPVVDTTATPVTNALTKPA